MRPDGHSAPAGHRMAAGPAFHRKASTLLARAIRLRCPNCGGKPLFDSWLRMRERCPACGLRTERGEDGYVVGGYMFNIMAAELLWAGLLLAVIWATWPTPPWQVLLYAGGGLMIALPFLCYPFSKTLFLAFDLWFRPAVETEAPGRPQSEAS